MIDGVWSIHAISWPNHLILSTGRSDKQRHFLTRTIRLLRRLQDQLLRERIVSLQLQEILKSGLVHLRIGDGTGSEQDHEENREEPLNAK